MTYISNVGGKLIVRAKGDIKTYAKENIVLNSNKKITITGEEKGVSFGEPEEYKSSREIISAKWYCKDLKEEIEYAIIGETVSILVETKNYKENEIVVLHVSEIDNKDVKKGTKMLTFQGKVKSDGTAELKEILEIEKV